MRCKSRAGAATLGVAQHNVNLTSVVRLMIKKVAARNVRRLDVVFALIVRVLERPLPKSAIETAEECLDPGVLPCPRIQQGEEVIIANLVERRCHTFSVLEQPHHLRSPSKM